MAEITSEMKSLNSLIIENSMQFKIPDFQRSFVWTDEQAKELINDFMEDTNNFQEEIDQLQGYLLGNIVLIKENENAKEALVVDGQQRLTTLTILFKVLFNRLRSIQESSTDQAKNTKWYQYMGDIAAGCQILDEDYEFKGLKVIHETPSKLSDTYKAIIKNELSTDISDNVDISNKNILSVYDALTELLDENHLDENQLKRFIKYIRTKVKLIVTIASSKEKAFQLFEVLNDRGRTLEPMDLIKSKFLQQLYKDVLINDEKRDVFNKYWNAFIDELGKQNIKTSSFVKHYILGVFGKNIKQDKIFEFFDAKNFESTEIISLAKSLAESAKIYAGISKNPMSGDFLEDNLMYILFKILKLKQMNSLLIPFYNASIKDKQRILNIAVKYGASILYSFTQTNKIEQKIEDVLSSTLKETDLSSRISEIERLLKESIESNVVILEKVLPERSFVNASKGTSKKALELLLFIEVYFNCNNNVLTDKKIELEHIMPKKSDAAQYGFENEKQHINFMNCIGNLTLLEKDLNIAVGNSKFKDKSENYKESNYIVTKTIVEKLQTTMNTGDKVNLYTVLNQFQPQYAVEDLWTQQQIVERGRNIARLLAYLLSPDIKGEPLIYA